KKSSNHSWLHAMKTVKGRLYSVQVNDDEVPAIEALGIPNYKSVCDIPEPIDYVVIAVPRRFALSVLEDCVKADVGGVSMFTSGFAETDDEGRELQEQIRALALSAGMPLAGPNCMGLFNPKLGVRNTADLYHGVSGPVGFIGQSGTHTIYYSTTLDAIHGIKLSKGISFGNAAVLDAADYLDYFAQDPEVQVIGAYIEGVREGQRFFETLRKLAPKKPVMIWKGGQTPSGASAASTHTGSLAGSQLIWDSMIRQAGAISVDSLDELIDTTAALLQLGELQGDGGGLMCMTGGQSVVIADTFAKHGLRAATLSKASYDDLGSFFNVIGGFYKNPLDISWNSRSGNLLTRILTILDTDPNVDFVALELFVQIIHNRIDKAQAGDISFLEAIVKHLKIAQKPFFTMLTPTSSEAEAIELRKKVTEAGILAFPTFQRAATAYQKALKYWQSRSR
ncbi:CoA-binding protein, partial [Dehalococcoidia bacterium]|nr:CoA-binding protein [Dehalococcoidia bacterium]